MSISDQIILMREGVIAQMGTPTEIYYHPNSEFVADFIGECNFLRGTVRESDGDEIRVQIGSHCVTAAWNRDVRTGEDCELVVRPEAIRIGREGMLPCKVELSCFMGSYQNYHVRVGDTLVKIADNCPVNKEIFREGENAWISFDKECAHLL